MEPVEIEFRVKDSDIESRSKQVVGSIMSIGKAAENTDVSLSDLNTKLATLKSQRQKLNEIITDAAKWGPVNKSLTAEFDKLTTEIAETEARIASYGNETKKTEDRQVSLRTQMRTVIEELVRMEQAGERGSEAYRQLQDEAGRLRDAMSDAQTQANVLAHDQAGMQGMISGLSGIAGAASAAQGAMSLFAGENENLNKLMLRVQSLMAITIGLQQVQQALNKDSAFRLVTVRKATELWSSAQKFLNVQLGLSATLSKALMASGIGVLIGGIALLVTHLKNWSAEQKEVSKANQEAMNSIRGQIVQVESLERVLRNSNAEQTTRAEALRQLKEIMPGYNAMLTDEGKLINDNTGALKTYIEQLKNSAMAKTYMDKLVTAQNNFDEWVNNLGKREKGVLLAGDNAAAFGEELPASDRYLYEVLDKQRQRITDNIDLYTQELERYEAAALAAASKSENEANTTTKNNTENVQKRLDAEQRINEQLRELQLKNQSDRIALMKDGVDKELAEIENEFRQQMAKLDKMESEWRKNQDGKLTTEQTDALDESFRIAADRREKAEIEAQEKVRAAAEKSMNDYLKEYGTYEEKRLAITKDYAEKISKAETEGERLTLMKEEDRAFAELDASFIKSSKLWKDIVGETSEMTLKEVKAITSELRVMVMSIADEDVRKELNEMLDEIEARTKKAAEQMNIFGTSKGSSILNMFAGQGDFKQKIQGITEAFSKAKGASSSMASNASSAASSAKGAGQNFMSSFSMVDTIIQNINNGIVNTKRLIDYFKEYETAVNGHTSKSLDEISQYMDALATFNDSAYSGFEKLKSGDVVGAITDNIVAWHGLLKSGKVLYAEFQAIQTDEFIANKEINQLYRERYDWTQKIGEATLTYLKRQGEEIKRQTQANATDQDDLWAKLMGTDYIESQEFKKRSFLGIDWLSKDTIQTTWASLAGKSWEEIERLAESGKLSEEGMKYYEALKAAREEGDDLADRQEEYIESLRELTTGTTYDSLVDGIVQAFQDGKRSAADFADTFDDLIRAALSSSLKLLTDAKMRKWYEEFAAMGEGGYTEEEIEQARQSYMAAIEGIAADAEALEKIAGQKLTAADTTQTAEKGGFQTVSQDSFDLWLGQFTAIRRHVEAIYNGLDRNLISTSQDSIIGAVRDVVSNTGNTVSELREVNRKLKLIQDEGMKLQ